MQSPGESDLGLTALLIGIDYYLPSQSPEVETEYFSLGGAVHDVIRTEILLRTKLTLPEERILKLIASVGPAGEPVESPDRLPTYENIVRAFKTLTDTTRPGEQVYIHYSGHGGRVPTRFEDLKGPRGLDETLVPTDIGKVEARHLRDIELAFLLDAMVKKGLIVTIVLDSCHSGGATRGVGDMAIRGVRSVDRTIRPAGSLVASDAGLSETWSRLSRGTTRDMALGSGWLPEPKGYVLLAACRPSEFACEYRFSGNQRSGALTYWLLDTLQGIGPTLSYKSLHNRIVGKVRSQFANQTPQLQGEATRVVFGVDKAMPQFAVNVLRVDNENDRVLLNTGQAQGIGKGAQFVIYPAQTDFAEIEKRLALVEVTEMGATESWAAVSQRLQENEPITVGSQAVLLDPGRIKLRRRVAIVDRTEKGSELSKAQKAIQEDTSGFLVLAEGSDSIDFQVAVSQDERYEIWDASGKPLPNLEPPLDVRGETAVRQLVGRLAHLAKYWNVRDLDNFDPMSPLAGKLEVEVLKAQNDFELGDKPEPVPFDDPGNTPELSLDEWVFLRIRNASKRVLNVVAIDLRPDWSIARIYPRQDDTDYMPFDPGQEQILPLKTYLPERYDEGTDVVKVFATLGPVSYQWLELPALGAPRTRSATSRGPENPLERLLAAMAVDAPRTRNLEPGRNPSGEWTAVQVELRMRRAR